MNFVLETGLLTQYIYIREHQSLRPQKSGLTVAPSPIRKALVRSLMLDTQYMLKRAAILLHAHVDHTGHKISLQLCND